LAANALVVRKTQLPTSQKALRAAQYVRMSTDGQRYSIQNQAAVIGAYAHAHNLTIVCTYRDEGESGLTLKNRAGLRQLLHDVSSGQADFENVLVYDVSRWGRFQDVDESAHYEFVCKQAGIKVAYCAEQFDNDGSMLSSIVKNLKRVMAAEYSRELSVKVHAGACRFARLGFKSGGLVGYALRRELVDEKLRPKGILKNGDRKYLITDHVRLRHGTDDEVAVVRWIFRQFLELKSETHLISKLAVEVSTRIEKAGRKVISTYSTSCLRIDGGPNISFQIARWCPGRKKHHSPYWAILREARLQVGWLIAIRLTEGNKAVHDFLLLATTDMVGPVMKLSERSRIRRGIKCFDQFNALARSITRLAATGRRTSRTRSALSNTQLKSTRAKRTSALERR
jgi:DNA invertase Pin-like site-specific DNA recombinase